MVACEVLPARRRGVRRAPEQAHGRRGELHVHERRGVHGALHDPLAQPEVLVGADAATSPAVLTLALPTAANSRSVGWRLQKAGFLLNYRSEYLARRNWIQICMMNECSQEKLAPLVNVLPRVCTPRPIATTAPSQSMKRSSLVYEA